MAYKYSDLDRKNLKWFPSDTSRATLLTVKIQSGELRGLSNLTIDFRYPITAIAGKNGSGKTTVLALVACAYHNVSNGFKLPMRKHPYYTFSDFFLQTSEEGPIGAMWITYQFLHDNWRPTKDMPKGSKRVGQGVQARIKRGRRGRWNNYRSRIKRTVVYLGIDRIVPHAERSVSRSYREYYLPVKARGWEPAVCQTVGRILGFDYGNFEHKQHTRYRLPVVKSGKVTYSGFNMGAGEDSLFEFFSIVNECPDGSLLLIDEIELGLHEYAQARLIQELKELCLARKFQIICTTHSPRILESLPPEGRIFLERVGPKTNVIPGISSAYATGKLSGRKNTELDILVEDEAAETILEAILDPELRQRTRVLPIGSSIAVMRHLSARYREGRTTEICAILDGDKSSERAHHVKEFCNALEQVKDQTAIDEWANSRLDFLPGLEWPEAWVVTQKSDAGYARLEREFQISRAQITRRLMRLVVRVNTMNFVKWLYCSISITG